MKTDDFAAVLAAGAGTAERHAAKRRFALATGCGVALVLLLMGGLLGARPDLESAVRLPMFWVKLGSTMFLAAVSFAGALRLGQPGRGLGWLPLMLLLPLAAAWLFAASNAAAAPPAQRWNLLLGQTWAVCPLLIALLSVPVFIAVFRAMRGLAPTRPPLAGAAAGLLAGAAGASVYCLHCSEMEALFLSVWYPLGMIIPAAAGALLGRGLLRW